MNATKEVIYTDVIGREIKFTKYHWYVTATDKVFSGWGLAKGRINKRIVICESRSQAIGVAENMQQSGEFKYVRFSTNNGLSKRVGLPRYSASRYKVSIHHADDCPLWNK